MECRDRREDILHIDDDPASILCVVCVVHAAVVKDDFIWLKASFSSRLWAEANSLLTLERN